MNRNLPSDSTTSLPSMAKFMPGVPVASARCLERSSNSCLSKTATKLRVVFQERTSKTLMDGRVGQFGPRTLAQRPLRMNSQSALATGTSYWCAEATPFRSTFCGRILLPKGSGITNNALGESAKPNTTEYFIVILVFFARGGRGAGPDNFFTDPSRKSSENGCPTRRGFRRVGTTSVDIVFRFATIAA